MADSFSLEHGIGAIGGGQLGCNYQTGMLVLGIEGEGWWSDITTTPKTNDASGLVADTIVRNKWDYDAAARFGLAVDRALIYGKAGFGVGRFNFSFANTEPFTEVAKITLNGLLIGVGLEYALSGPWTIKFEYDHLTFGTRSAPFNNCFVGNCVTDFFSESASKDVFKLGVNYFFYK